MLRSIWVYFIISLWLYALPQNINEEIRKSGIANKDISIYIKEAGRGGKVIASLNGQKQRTPASVIKVLTTYSAVLELGFDYRWPTKFYTAGVLHDGVLQGDLIIEGFGDPTLSDDDLAKIVTTIRAEGIDQIKGDIVIDRSYFKVGNKDSSGFDDHPYSAYNAMPDAMMFNERISTVCVTPNKNEVYKKNNDESYKVVNQLEHVNKPCTGRYSWPGVRIDKSEVVPVVLLKGKISKKCGKRNICQVLTKPYKSFYYALKDRLQQEGVKVEGTLQLKRVPQNAVELFTYYSDSLEEIISETAKESNNLYARHLLLLLGAKVYGAPATLDKGRSAIDYILESKDVLKKGSFHIDNGSGLSRTAKLSAKVLADIFDNAYDRYGDRWMQTLSIAGVDGTIKRRFRGTVVRKRAWMKTGTVKHVKNIGGYVKNIAGKLYTVVIMVNGPKVRYLGAKLQDDIIKWLVKSSAKPTAKSSARPSSKIVQKKKPITQKLFTEVKTAAPSKAKEITKTLSQRYYVQAGSFSKMPDKHYLLKIESLGLHYSIRHSDNYKVLIGAYKDEKGARGALGKVRKHINKGAFITKF
ncbi:MAG: D-alanyl-D-alanine carboxypeptidase/D-alanyl-D-alanine-endopeptidase [Sulfurovum sp.]|nr:D-alanyl-D-alanine carboxypeptidase/D-alanyl-D-alanine-endopeptidase [Sulfurovum sp.]